MQRELLAVKSQIVYPQSGLTDRPTVRPSVFPSFRPSALPLNILPMRQRFGLGYDAHTFGADRPLKLGGVEIDHTTGLTGHSDGDAVTHALIDALLGAAAMGDIGQLFPDTDPRWKGADSMQMLAEVKRRLTAASYFVFNVDITVVTEKPKIAPHAPAIREKLAVVLGVSVDAVSIKAKTNEKMDTVGRGKGLMVYAIASLGGA